MQQHTLKPVDTSDWWGQMWCHSDDISEASRDISDISGLAASISPRRCCRTCTSTLYDDDSAKPRMGMISLGRIHSLRTWEQLTDVLSILGLATPPSWNFYTAIRQKTGPPEAAQKLSPQSSQQLRKTAAVFRIKQTVPSIFPVDGMG